MPNFADDNGAESDTMTTDNDMIGTRHTAVLTTGLQQWADGPTVMSGGMVMVCRSGRARLDVNFSTFELLPGTIITLFPNDVVALHQTDGAGLRVEALTYDADLLREACLQMEQTVYRQLRDNRCRPDAPTVTAIVDTMLRLLRLYSDDLCMSEQTAGNGQDTFDTIVLLHLKAFFLGFHDYVRREGTIGQPVTSRRRQELFNRFMTLVEQRYHELRNVSDYAALMNITPKYLNNIVQAVTQQTAKTVIDHFVVLQLKAALRTGGLSLKEISCRFNFNDQSFFCRYFKQHTGMTPKSFRQGSER